MNQATAQPNNKDVQKDYTHYPPQQSIKSYNLINLYISLPSNDSQRKESQLVSPVLLLLRRTIVFCEGLWRSMSDSPLRSPLTAPQLDR
ncbi:MAG: hypothetical protein ACK552_16475 [Microcystis sp.]